MFFSSWIRLDTCCSTNFVNVADFLNLGNRSSHLIETAIVHRSHREEQVFKTD